MQIKCQWSHFAVKVSLSLTADKRIKNCHPVATPGTSSGETQAEAARQTEPGKVTQSSSAHKISSGIVNKTIYATLPHRATFHLHTHLFLSLNQFFFFQGRHHLAIQWVLTTNGFLLKTDFDDVCDSDMRIIRWATMMLILMIILMLIVMMMMMNMINMTMIFKGELRKPSCSCERRGWACQWNDRLAGQRSSSSSSS